MAQLNAHQIPLFSNLKPISCSTLDEQDNLPESDPLLDGETPLNQRIPTCWTPEQALVVADFLTLLTQAIWEVYGAEIGSWLKADGDRPIPRHEDEDDIPF